MKTTWLSLLLALTLCLTLAVCPVSAEPNEDGDGLIDASELFMNVLYVSPDGNDANSGLVTDSPLKTLDAAFAKTTSLVNTVVLLGDTAYAPAPAHTFPLTVKGANASVKLLVSGDVSLTGPTSFDHLTTSGGATVYANGFDLTVTETVSSTDRLTVFGGANGTALTGDTNLVLYGGKYRLVYGGGNGAAAAVNGNTHVTIGGSFNAGDSIDDDSSAYFASYIAGGGYGAPVNGATYVTVEDGARAAYVFGAGRTGSATAKETNVVMNGGKVMNIYGGAEGAVQTGCNTHVTLNGGLVEAIFGASISAGFTGNTTITVLGGDVSRRIYTGCYNNGPVKGTTTLVLGPSAKLCTGTELSSGNSLDMTVRLGSRSGTSGEVNGVVYLDDCYNALNSKVRGTASYTVKAGRGGRVEPTTTAGLFRLLPDENKLGYADGTPTDAYQFASTGTVNVTFEAVDAYLYSVSAFSTETKVYAYANVLVNTEADPALLFVAAYDEDGRYVGGGFADAVTAERLPVSFARTGTPITFKAMILDKVTTAPLCEAYSGTIAASILKNGDAEADGPAGAWLSATTNASITYIDDPDNSDNRVISVNPAGKSPIYVYCRQHTAYTPGKSYHVEADLYPVGRADGEPVEKAHIACNIIYADAEGKEQNHVVKQYSSLPVGEWTHVSFDFTVAADSASRSSDQFTFYANPIGGKMALEYRLDNIFLTEK